MLNLIKAAQEATIKELITRIVINDDKAAKITEIALKESCLEDELNMLAICVENVTGQLEGVYLEKFLSDKLDYLISKYSKELKKKLAKDNHIVSETLKYNHLLIINLLCIIEQRIYDGHEVISLTEQILVYINSLLKSNLNYINSQLSTKRLTWL